MQRAKLASSPEKEALLLNAVFLLRDENDIQQALSILGQIPFETLPDPLKGQYLIEYAELNFKTHEFEKVNQALTGEKFNISSYYDNLSLETQVKLGELRARAFSSLGQHLDSIKEYLFITPLIPEDELESHYSTIWENLNSLPIDFLEKQIKETPRNELKGWLELAYLNLSYQYDINTQLEHLKNWIQVWSLHPAASHLPNSLSLLIEYEDHRPENIAVLLPFSGKLANTGNIIRDGIMASYFAASANSSHIPSLTFYDSAATSGFNNIYQMALDDGAELIIGPLSKDNVNKLLEKSSLPVPTLALNRNNLDKEAPENLYQFGLNPEDEVIQIANKAWEDGHVNAAVLFPDKEWGYRISEKFKDVWHNLNGNIVSSTAYNPGGNYRQSIESMLKIQFSHSRAKELKRITGLPLEFEPRRRDDVHFIFIIASPIQARQLKPALLHADARYLPVYSTSSAYEQEGNKSGENDDINGLIFCDMPWVLLDNDEIKTFSKPVWPNMTTRASRLFALGVDAYRLQGRLIILESAPETRVHGATGSLSMDEKRQVRRELIWAEIKNGQLKELPVFYGDISE